MPSLFSARIISSSLTNNSKDVGEWHKNNSDFTMEYTWDNDIQSKICYIYDYAHDDQPEKNKYITYDNTSKMKIDAKFIITSYGSIDKDQVAYHLMFKPSEKIDFTENDEMYYYETDYRKKFDMTYPVGLYIDIPDEKGIYNKWLIVDYEEGNQFTKYVILPCDHRLEWIDIEKNKRVKRRMWCCTRSANSYTSGLWVDRYFSLPDDINKLLLPLNNITKSFGYILSNNENQRVILSAKMDYPLTWKVSKIENTKPVGIVKATLKEAVFNPSTDYIEKDEEGNIVGMWADYFASQFEPILPEENNDDHEQKDYIHCHISATQYSIKNGGSYRTITSKYLDENENDVSYIYTNRDKTYYFEIDDIDVSDKIIYVVQEDKNKIKIKVNNNDYIGKVLTIRTYIDHMWGEIKLEII